MEKTLSQGDIVLVNLLAHGSSLPNSPLEISGINLFAIFSSKIFHWYKTINWEYRRLPGYTDYFHDEIIVFKSTLNQHRVLVKRLFAIPGDTVWISSKHTFHIDKAAIGASENQAEMQYLVVPRKGQKVIINDANISYYKLPLEKTEHIRLDSLTMPFVHIFQRDCFFLIGDNKRSSSDSRHWGLVPENNVIGKVVYVFK